MKFTVGDVCTMDKTYISVVSLKMVKDRYIPYAGVALSSKDMIVDIVNSYIGVPDREHFIVIGVDAKLKPTYIETVSIGSLNGAAINPREVYKSAILSNSNGIFCFHNHPSGDCEPSSADIETTERLKMAGKILGIELIDHIIYGDSAVSLRERGYIE